MPRNRWPESIGMGGRNGPEYAASNEHIAIVFNSTPGAINNAIIQIKSKGFMTTKSKYVNRRKRRCLSITEKALEFIEVNTPNGVLANTKKGLEHTKPNTPNSVSGNRPNTSNGVSALKANTSNGVFHKESMYKKEIISKENDDVKKKNKIINIIFFPSGCS